MRKFTKDDLEALDVQDYLASDSGDESGDVGMDRPSFRNK